MNSNTAPVEQSLDGTMLFFKQPELLNHQEHGSLGLRRPERPYEFASSARVVPLTLGEISSAQKHYPVIFSDIDNPMPLAVVGRDENVNLFIDENGGWKRGAYIPAYARCYPFALAARSNDEFAVVIDRAADSVTDDPEQPFFDGGKITPETQSLMDFCARYDAESRRTAEFGQRLKELGLLVGQQVTRTAPGGEAEPFASYITVDGDKLNELEASALQELFSNGFLAGAFAQLFSLENWQLIIERQLRYTGAPESG
ncbi:MAG: SapC family protein [Woeseiaceae bacterium]